jgi:uncharacterized damage-inducible protein DinB
MRIELLRKTFEHMWWADARAGSALASALGLDDDGGSPNRKNRNRAERALELYAHILGAELIWIDRIEGLPPSDAVWPQADLRRCQGLLRTVKLRYADLLDGLENEDMARDIRYVNSAGQAFTSKLDDILMHVALHGAYHRGQVALLIRSEGGEPEPTDYIAFVRGAPAATRQLEQNS